MTGRSRSGKMSARIRLTANEADRAMAIAATRTVIGRRRAARISHMSGPSCAPEAFDERRHVTRRDRLGEGGPPHVDLRRPLLVLGLRQQVLRLGDLDDAGEPRV